MLVQFCLFLSVSVRFSLFVSIYVRFRPLFSVYVCFCSFMYVYVGLCQFLSVSVCFCPFLSVSVRLCLLQSISCYVCEEVGAASKMYYHFVRFFQILLPPFTKVLGQNYTSQKCSLHKSKKRNRVSEFEFLAQ